MQSPTNTISVFFYCTILVVCLSHQSDARDTINTSHPLRDDANESLVSARGIFELGFFTPGPGGNNRYVGIWYHNMPRRVVWVANRDKPVTDSSGSFAIAEDGNLKVLSNRNAYAITDLKNAGVNSTVKLMDNGNLIFFDGPSLLWQSFNDPTDTFLPGMKMDDKMVLTSWSTSTDPASGDYTFQKYQELYEIQMRSVPYWRSGESGLSIIKNKMPYAVADMLSGFKEGLDESKYPSSGSQNKGKVSFNFTRSSNDNVSGLFMNGTGEIQYYRWSDGEWTFLWSEPKDTCSFYKYCGKFSICDSNRDPECNCLPGYQPVSKVDSNNGDYSVDCEKRKQIRCDNNANQSTFLNLSLTNFRASFQKFDKARNKEECEKECLNNCKCEAYYMSEKYNAKRTGESDVVPSCFIGTGDLENLCRVDGESRVQLNVRVDMDLKTRDCKPCGDIMIPYPLSTGPNCGDPLYSSFDCNDSTDIFYFKTLSRQYRVISINKENRTFGVRNEIANSCYARIFPREIVNQSSPFTVTNRCYERGIEIRWKPSLEPSCNVSGDCRDWPNSSCHARENGMSRCYCDQEYQWDGTSLNCVQGLTARDSRDCKLCGDIMIPYPLSTGPNCGDPLYSSFDCDKSTGIFHFQTLSGNYSVININKANRTFVIEVNSETANSCDARNLSRQIVKLNQSSPFTVTNGCYKRRIEISWKPPLEPSCNVSGDCRDWPNSSCHARANGMSRCYCDQEYQWDGTSLNCVQGTGRSLARWLKDVIIIIAVFAAVLLVCFFSYYLYRRKRMTRRKGSGENSGENPVVWSYESSDRQVSDLMDEENKSGVGVPFCSWESILAATENFSDVHKLGRGGFGPVYKGMFPGGQEIAVKRLSSYSVQGINEFRNEVVLIAKLQHRNLVRLLGYCIKENEKILLYEYMPNKSLDAFIFDKKLSMLLNWKKRFDIILGIARGVLYLHQDSRLRIIHRDLKTSNILLDEEMNPKISDFGLARIVEGKGTEASTNKVVGTYGYMSPEYVLEGLFSTKSDVFSFGVVVLEIISGKRNTGFYGSAEALNLLGYAWGLWSENKALDLMDPMLLESCEKSEVMKCINVGLLCVQEDPGDRPTMSNVVFMLGGEATVLPVPNQPAFVMRKHVFSTSSSSTKPGSISNELTMSQVEGR